MITWIKSLLFDETAFRRFGRALIFLFGTAIHNGVIPLSALQGPVAWWLGPLVMTASLVIGAGDKNPQVQEGAGKTE